MYIKQTPHHKTALDKKKKKFTNENPNSIILSAGWENKFLFQITVLFRGRKSERKITILESKLLVKTHGY